MDKIWKRRLKFWCKSDVNGCSLNEGETNVKNWKKILGVHSGVFF